MPLVSFTLKPSQRFFGVAQNAFDRLGLEQLLPQYHIMTTHEDSWDTTLMPAGLTVTCLAPPKSAPTTVSLTTKKILALPHFKKIIKEQAAAGQTCYVMVYKNDADIANAAASLPLKLLANDYTVRWDLENKATFRERFKHLLPLPPHQLIQVADLTSAATDYDHWHQLFGSFVLQDEQLSDGKGTFIIHTIHEYEVAVTRLKRNPHHRLVVSKYIAGEVASIQACLTRHGIFSSSIQQQFFAQPELTSHTPGATQFCGGQWNCRTYSNHVHQQVATITHALKQELAPTWRGIFGVDLLITPDDQVYVLEINARLTGLTTPLAMLQHRATSTNLLLLHLLELAEIPYTLADPTALQNHWRNVPTASYSILHNRFDWPITRTKDLASGVYRITPTECTFVRPGFSLAHLEAPDEVLIPDVPAKDKVIAPGMRVLRFLSLQPAVDKEGHCTPFMQQTLSLVEEAFSPTS